MRSPVVMLLWSLAIALLVWSSLTPRLAPPGAFQLDKLAHIAAYALLAALPALALARRAAVFAAGLLLALVGIGIELAQAAVPGREGSAADALANLAGIVLGLAAGLALRRARRRRAATWT